VASRACVLLPSTAFLWDTHIDVGGRSVTMTHPCDHDALALCAFLQLKTSTRLDSIRLDSHTDESF